MNSRDIPRPTLNDSRTHRVIAYGWPCEDMNVPVVPNLWQRVKDAIEAEPDRFDMNWWHGMPYDHALCKTSHCMAGWIVTLAGDEGMTLERLLDTPVAAALIHLASCPWTTELPRFFPDDYGVRDWRCESEAKTEIDKFAAEEALHTQQS